MNRKNWAGKTVNWYLLNANTKLEEWKRTVGWIEDGEVLLIPAAAVGFEFGVAFSAMGDGVPVTMGMGHPFVCSDWVLKNYPDETLKAGLIHLRGVIKEVRFDDKMKEVPDAESV